MVQTDLSQLSAECTEWRQILRNYRDEFNQDKKLLQDYCKNELSRPQLQEVEHFSNQLHIQLINIHDLKQAIKTHERCIGFESENTSSKTYAEHERLLSEFLTLESTLQQLRTEFSDFVTSTSCG